MKKKSVLLLAIAASIAFVFYLSGCGSSSSNTSTSNLGQSSHAMLSVGDAPLDGILSFEATINSVMLTASDGTQVSVLSSPTKVELSHLAGTVEPISLTGIPQGTYTQITVTVSSAEVTALLSGSSSPVTQMVTPNPATVVVTLSPAITVGSAAVAINLDFNLAQSLTVNGSTISFAPVITANAAPVAANENDQDEHDGEFEAMGTIQSLGTNQFTLQTHSVSSPFTITVDSNTEFDGVQNFAALTVGEIVEVKAATGADGTLDAKKIEVDTEEDNGEAGQGLVTSVTGSPATQITVLLQDSDSQSASIGQTATVSIGGNTTFEIHTDGVSLSGLPFTPAFDATTIAAGQAVEADSDSDGGMDMSASRIRLIQQALTGTVSNIQQQGSNTTFTLTLPADSTFAMLSGQTTVTVVQTSNTSLSDSATVQSGATVRVRGLVFVNGGAFDVVADQIGQP